MTVKELIRKPSQERLNNPKASITLGTLEKVGSSLFSIMMGPPSVWFILHYYYKSQGYIKKSKQQTTIALVVFVGELLLLVLLYFISYLTNR